MNRIAASLFVVLLLGTLNANADLQAKPKSLDLYGHQVQGTTTADGSLVAFVVEPDKEITYRRETAPGSGTWGERKSLGAHGNWIMPGKHADGRITVFIIGTLGNVLSSVTQAQVNSDNWNAEQELEDSYGMQIQPVSYADGRLALFFLDMGREVSVIEETAVNSGRFGGHRNLDLNGNRFEVGSHGDGTLDIALIGTMGNVLTHAVPDGDGKWHETAINDAYAMDLSFQNSADGKLQLFFLSMQREVVRVDMTMPVLSPVEMDLYGNDIATTRSADGSIEIILIGTLGNVLGHSRQASPNAQNWGGEQEMTGYAKWLGPVETAAGPVLFVVAPLANEVFVYQ